jgi:hypothetical protein
MVVSVACGDCFLLHHPAAARSRTGFLARADRLIINRPESAELP